MKTNPAAVPVLVQGCHLISDRLRASGEGEVHGFAKDRIIRSASSVSLRSRCSFLEAVHRHAEEPVDLEEG